MPPLTGLQVPEVQATPQMPQLAGSFVRFLQTLALGPWPQQAVPTPLQALCWQSGSAQSTRPSQS